jgi:hypothetical protein
MGGLGIALAVALHVWGAPACGQVSVAWVPDEPVVGGRAENCVIDLNSAYGWPALYRGNWPLLCTVVVHEWGHLTGHNHVSDPTNVMYDNSGPIGRQPYWRCETTRPNFGFPASVALGSGTVRGLVHPVRRFRPR